MIQVYRPSDVGLKLTLASGGVLPIVLMQFFIDSNIDRHQADALRCLLCARPV